MGCSRRAELALGKMFRGSASAGIALLYFFLDKAHQHWNLGGFGQVPIYLASDCFQSSLRVGKSSLYNGHTIRLRPTHGAHDCEPIAGLTDVQVGN